MPFRLAGGEDAPLATVTLAEMLGEFAGGGSMAEFVASQQQLADWGYLSWDRRSNTAAICIPADAVDRLTER
jgi:hypothetical protein